MRRKGPRERLWRYAEYWHCKKAILKVPILASDMFLRYKNSPLRLDALILRLRNDATRFSMLLGMPFEVSMHQDSWLELAVL